MLVACVCGGGGFDDIALDLYNVLITEDIQVLFRLETPIFLGKRGHVLSVKSGRTVKPYLKANLLKFLVLTVERRSLAKFCCNREILVCSTDKLFSVADISQQN